MFYGQLCWTGTAGDGYKICGNGAIGLISVPVQLSIANFETMLHCLGDWKKK